MSTPKRIPDFSVKCEDCGKKLDYDYGSIVWQCQEHDLCLDCKVGKMTKETLAADGGKG